MTTRTDAHWVDRWCLLHTDRLRQDIPRPDRWDLLPPGVIDALTRLVLTNAIYFNAAWLYPFSEDLTRDGDFHLLTGGEVIAPMMTRMIGSMRDTIVVMFLSISSS